MRKLGKILLCIYTAILVVGILIPSKSLRTDPPIPFKPINLSTVKSVPKPQGPVGNYFVYRQLNSEKHKIIFSWSKESEQAKIILQISKNNQFNPILGEFECDGNNRSVELVPDTYFWRIKYSSGLKWSPVQKFDLGDDYLKTQFTVLSPFPSSHFTWRERKTIQLSWKYEKDYPQYQVQIYPMGSGNWDTAQTFLTKGSVLYIPFELPGVYHWRVRAINDNNEIGQFNLSYSFSIGPKLELSQFQIFAKSEYLKESNNEISWKVDPEYNGIFLIEFSKNQNFQNVVHKIQTREHHLTIPEIGSGPTYFRISSLETLEFKETQSPIFVYSIKDPKAPSWAFTADSPDRSPASLSPVNQFVSQHEESSPLLWDIEGGAVSRSVQNDVKIRSIDIGSIKTSETGAYASIELKSYNSGHQLSLEQTSVTLPNAVGGSFQKSKFQLNRVEYEYKYSPLENAFISTGIGFKEYILFNNVSGTTVLNEKAKFYHLNLGFNYQIIDWKRFKSNIGIKGQYLFGNQSQDQSYNSAFAYGVEGDISYNISKSFYIALHMQYEQTNLKSSQAENAFETFLFGLGLGAEY